MNWEQDDTFLSKWLNGELSEEYRAAFESTEEGQDFIRLIQASSLIKPSEYDVDSELAKLQSRIESSPTKKTKNIWLQTNFQLAIAASVLLLVAVVYLFTLGDNTVKTGFSEQEIAQLPDGSEIKLNAVSQISYDPKTWDEKREVELKGEAFFMVKKGSRFEVITEHGNVQVLGTSFNVKSRGQFFDVECYTGKVEVTSESITQQLTPGEVIRIKGGEMVLFKKADLNGEPSWTNGVTKLDNVKLPIVLNELKYIFDITIVYDGTLDDVIYFGSFPNQKAEAAFKLVFDPLNIDYSYNPTSKELIILGLNK